MAIAKDPGYALAYAGLLGFRSHLRLFQAAMNPAFRPAEPL